MCMDGCELNHKENECRRIDTFELWCWRRLLRVPWTAKRSNQSILKEISPEYSLEYWSWSSNTLATWREELTHWKRPWCWERLKAGGEGDNREWNGWMASPTRWTWVWASSGRWWRTGNPGVLHGITESDVNGYWTATTKQERLFSMCKGETGFYTMIYPSFMGSWRAGHDWTTSLTLFTFMHWRRKWQATPVFLPGESHGRGSLVGCRLWGHTESDTTEVT